MAESDAAVPEAERRAAPAAATSAAATGAPDRESVSRTFFTAIDAQPDPPRSKGREGKSGRSQYRTLEATNAGPLIVEHFGDLTNLARNLDKSMEALLNEHEKDFYLAYKTYMYSVQREIKMLRMKADHEEEKTRDDTKIKDLESTLDGFMTEALRLDELCKGYKKEVDKWKAKSDALDEDRRFLEDQIKGAKRQNKILRAAAERARSSAYSALMVTKARTEAQERAVAAASEQPALTGPPRAQVGRRPASASSAAGGGIRGVRQAMEVRSRTPDHHLSPKGQSDSSRPQLLHGHSTGSLGSRPPSGSGSFAGSFMPARTGLASEEEERHVQEINQLREAVARESHTVRMLQAARATSYSQKSELEEFFLKCIDEARKDLMRKRHLTMNKMKNEREMVLEEMLSNEDVLVCLYEQLFPHRTGIARSLGEVDIDSTDVQSRGRLALEDNVDGNHGGHGLGYGHGHGHGHGQYGHVHA